MTKTQDENIYHRILELPKEVTSPDAYQLLGLARFESDPKKIKTAAMDRNALLQRMQNAENYEAVKRLEREVGEAMVCLSNPTRKAEYDQKLTQPVAIMEAPPKPPAPPVQDTQPIKNANVATVEVKSPPPPPPKPEPEKKKDPKSGVQFLPPPAGKAKKEQKSERPERKESKKFLPGEAPWQSKERWWQKNPQLAKGIGISAGLGLLLILVLSFFRPSPVKETIAEEVESTKPSTTQQQTETVSQVIGLANAKQLSSQVLFKNESGTLADFAMAPDASWIATLDDQGLIHVWDSTTGSSRELNSIPGEVAGSATHLAATPDGGHLFVATTLGHLQEWPMTLPMSDAGSIMPQIHTSHAFAPGVCSLEASLDGQHIFGTNANSELFVLDRTTSQTTTRDLSFEPVKPLNVLAASPKSQSVAVCFADQSLRLWNPGQPLEVFENLIPATTGKPDFAATYSSDGTHLALVGADHQIRLLDAANPQAVPILCQGHTGRVYALTFSPDGTLLASVGADRALRLWDTSNGTELAALGGYTRSIMAVQFAADGKSLLTASQDGMVPSWQVDESASEPPPILPTEAIAGAKSANPISESGAARLAVSHRFQMTDTAGPFDAILRPLTWAAISPEGSHVAGTTGHDKVFIQDTKSQKPLHILPISVRTPGMVEFSADGQTLIAVQEDGWLSTWDVATGRLLDRINFTPNAQQPQTLAVESAGPRFALPSAANVDFRSRMEDLSAAPESISQTQASFQLALSDDGQFLATNSGTAVEVWHLGDPADALSPRLIQTFPFQDYSIVRAMTLSADGAKCAVSSTTGKIHVFSTRTGQELASFTGHSNAELRGLEFDSEGSLLFSIGTDEGVRVWSTTSWNLLASLPPLVGLNAGSQLGPMAGPGSIAGGALPLGMGSVSNPPIRVQRTSDGKQLVVVHQSGLGVVWEVGARDNTLIAADFTAIDLSVSGSAQSVTSKNFAATKKWTEFPAHPQPVTHLDFSPDGKYFLTAGTDGFVRVWSAQTGSLLRQMMLPAAPGNQPADAGFPAAPLGIGLGGVVPGAFGPQMVGIAELGGLRHWAISPDNLLATSMDGRLIQLWDIATGANKGTIGDSKEDHLWFGFSPDGKTFAKLLTTGILKSWNVSDSSALGSVSLRVGTAFSQAPKGSGYWFALGDASGAVWVVNADGTTIALPGTGVPFPVGRLQFSKDGTLLAAADAPGTVRVWEIATKREFLRTDTHGINISDLEFTPDGKALLTLSQSGSLEALGIDPANPRRNQLSPARPPGGLGFGLTLNDPQTAVIGSKQVDGTFLAVSPDGTMLVIAGGTDSLLPSERGKLAFWGVGDKPAALSGQALAQGGIASPDAITRSNLDQIQPLSPVKGHSAVHSVAFCPDGQAFVSGGSDHVAIVWNPYVDPPAKVHNLTGHDHPIRAVAASLTYLATGDSEGYIKIWIRQTGQELQLNNKKAQHNGAVEDLSFSSNGRLASAGEDKRVSIWDPATMVEAAKHTGQHKSIVTSLTWAEVSRSDAILSCDAGGKIVPWVNPLQTKPKSPIDGLKRAINDIASAPGGKSAFACENGLVGLWNGNNGPNDTPHTLSGHTKPVKCVAFTPDGDVLASAGGDGTILFWSTDGVGALLHTLQVPVEMDGTTYQIQAMDISPDGRWLLTGDAGGYLKLWGVPKKED